MGDIRPPNLNYSYMAAHRTSSNPITNQVDKISNITLSEPVDEKIPAREKQLNMIPYNNSHPWGIFFTILGTVLLDFDADACQSPARAYLLDVTVPGKNI